MELFPALVIGGPPNSGKSVLTYHLSQALRQCGLLHYVLRAAPDGEGDWTNEASQKLVRTILAPRPWTPDFVEYICRSLEQRHLPLLVDVGGLPTPWQEPIFDHCTHAVLLTPDEPGRLHWQNLIARHQLLPLADLRSTLHGASLIAATSPILTGVIAGLECGRPVSGPTFEALVERVAHLFDYEPDQLRRYHLTSAPVENTIDLDRLAHSLHVPVSGQKAIWEPRHLPALLDYLPPGQPLGLYGRGPNWLYAAVALQTYPAPFYQFDVRLGWVTPPRLEPGLPGDTTVLQCQQEDHSGYTDFTFTIRATHLDYDESQGIMVPHIPPGRSLVLGGKIPHWLITALTIAYQEAALLAVYQPQVGRVVIRSRIPGFAPGDLLDAV